MSKRLLDEWKQRLAYADAFWQKNGLSGESTGEDNDVFKYIEMYRGNHWPDYGWGGFGKNDCITVNVTAANTHAMISRLSKRNPEVVVTAESKGPEQSARARKNQLTLNVFQKRLKFKREVDWALRDALLTPFGLVEHVFTPHIEKYDKDGEEIETYSMSRPDLPGIRRRPFWDVRIDPLATTWHPDGDATWVAFRDLLTMDQIRGNKSLTKPHDLKPTKSVDLLGVKKRQRGRGQDEDPEWYQLVEVWRVYNKIDKRFFAFSPGSSQFLREPDEWPIPRDDLPYSYLAFNEQMDTNVPLPFPALYHPQQVELNKNRTLMAELVKRLRRIVAARRSAFTDEDQKKLQSGILGLQELFLVDGSLADAIKDIQIGGFPQELLLYDAKIREDIREQMGLSQMDRAQRVNVESAQEAAQIQAGSDTQSSRPQEVFEAFWADVMRKFHQGLRHTLTQEVLVPVSGLADREAMATNEEFVTITREDLQGDFTLDIRVGSTTPKNHDQEFAKAVQLKSIFQGDTTVDQQQLTHVIIEESGFDSARLVRTPEQIAATEQVLAQRGQGGPPGGGGEATPGLDANFMRNLSPRGSLQ